MHFSRKQREMLQCNNKMSHIIFQRRSHTTRCPTCKPLKITFARPDAKETRLQLLTGARDSRLASSSTSVRRICLDLPEVLPPGHYDVSFPVRSRRAFDRSRGSCEGPFVFCSPGTVPTKYPLKIARDSACLRKPGFRLRVPVAG